MTNITYYLKKCNKARIITPIIISMRFILISLLKLFRVVSVISFVETSSDSILVQVAFSSACLEIIVFVFSTMNFASELSSAKFDSKIEIIVLICSLVFSILVLMN